jgi:two-component system, LytTR family, response regulator
VRAFEVNAIDYLLKPIERARLDLTLERLARRRDTPAGGSLRDALDRLARDLRANPFLDHLASRVRDRVHMIPVGDVTHLLARERATYAVTAGAEHMLDMTLAELERRLDPARFFRIHRAILVNVAWLGEVRADGGGHLSACLKDPRRTELPVSRDRARPLKERLGLV